MTRITHMTALVVAAQLCSAADRNSERLIIHQSKLPELGSNAFAVGNRAPLTPSYFRKLPIGSIRPEGWVRRQLELEAEGYTGRLTEISPWLDKKDNAWLSPTGEGKNGWEEVPYWLKGFGDLGYVLGNKRIIQEAKLWVNAVIASQREDGYFGPRANLTANNGKPDVWPNMVMLNALQTYYEFSGDKRVLDLMGKYFKWELTIPDADFLLSYWEPQRAGDNMESVFWLYNRTGDKAILALADKLHRCGANWSNDVPNWHGVNMAQGFREPAEYAQVKHDSSLTEATERDYAKMRQLYGQVPGGLYGADENARPGFTDPRQAAETCTMVEMMLSDELLLCITGAPSWAERCEDVAFNSLPASMTPDLKSLHYLTSPNMVLVDKGSKSPELQNGGPMLLFNAYDHRCCQHNASHGWPYYAEHLWLATAHNGLGVALYGPSRVTAKVGNGTPVTISETTSYPFEESIRFRFSTSKPNRFPLTLRWPTWCERPSISLGKIRISPKGKPGGYIVIDRTWHTNDVLELSLPMSIKTHTWVANKNAVSVDRGPLTYSLKIGEQYVRMGGTDKFPSYEIHPTTPWNYGLVTDHQRFQVVKKGFPTNGQPFTPDAVPVTLKARARKIDQWVISRLGLVGALQSSPAKTSTKLETVTLVPMGAARLRIASFPTVSTQASAHAWKALAKGKKPIPAAASHVFEGDTLDALSDGLLPSSSSDLTIPRFTWWDRRGTSEWVEYRFPKARTVSEVGVYWYDDQTTGGQCRLPQSWEIMALVHGEWKPVSVKAPYELAHNRFSKARFQPISCNAIRIQAQLQPNVSAGILEWTLNP